MSQNIGSLWRKWDLHVHTQASDGESSNEEIIQIAKEKNIAVLGITDHHTTRNIDAMKELGAQHGIKIIPGIEFRTELGKHSVHLIALFPDTFDGISMDSKNLYDLILAPLGLAESIIREKGLQAGASEQNALKKGIFQTQVNFTVAANFVHKYGGIVIPHNGSKSNGLDAEVSHEGKPGTTIYNSLGPLKDELCQGGYIDVFDVPFNDESDRTFYLNNLHIPSISTSDAHRANEVGESFSWIKSDTTFEGLKQAILEPSRIFIGINKPTRPIHHISKVITNFANDTKLKSPDSSVKEIFCFSSQREIELSPEFTCIIGGRGTGKSTFLSIIGKSLGKAPNSILESIEYSAGQRFSDFVSLEGAGDFGEADYISQAQVADFASNPELLTNTIYQRIKKIYPFDEIISLENDIKQISNSIDKEISNIRQFATLEHDITKKIQEKQAKQNLVNSLTSSEYQKIASDLKQFSEEYKKFLDSKQLFFKLLDMLADITSLPPISSEKINEYDQLIDRILQDVQKITIDYDKVSLKQKEIELQQRKDKAADDLKQYLINKNINQENVNDIVQAQLQIKELDDKIAHLEKEKNSIELCKISSFKERLERLNNDYKEKLSQVLDDVSKKLDIKNSNLKQIILKLGQNDVKMENSFWNDFRKEFEVKFMVIAEQLGNPSFGYRESYIKSLFDEKNMLDLGNMSQQDFLQEMKLSDNEKNFTKRILFRILNNDYRFKVFKLLIFKHFLDLSANKQFNILYDNKNIEKTSFGQRCTATIITLLSLGNTPIIIDEPEAHLDSLLIADYLVKLIKEKKFDRQIIFATHNPNFVVNGDADLILSLSINNDGITEILPLTIENLEHRDKILSLEGGEDAFKKRENKYRI